MPSPNLLSLSAEINSLTKRVDDMEQYSRRNCLKISGIPESEGEDTDTLLLSLLNEKLHLNTSINDMSRSHRVNRFQARPAINTSSGSSRPSRPRDIRVRFNSYRVKAQVYQARFTLCSNHDDDSTDPRIFINEALTSQRAMVFKHVRMLVKHKLALKARTYDGSIVIRDPNNKNHKVVHCM